jgi:hypothetical protein
MMTGLFDQQVSGSAAREATANPDWERICNSKPDRNVVLTELRRLSARLLLAKLEIDSAGTALSHGAIEPDAALEWLINIDPELDGLLGIVPAEIAA